MSLYTTIGKSSREIRLIVVHPSHDPTASIKCSLVQAISGTERDFEALSYTWGEGKIEGKIWINDHEISISENLHVALQHLRLKDEERILWVDALCINQSDTHERNHQVQQMSQIYASSWRVLIWLGPESEDSTRALDFIDRVDKNVSEWVPRRDIRSAWSLFGPEFTAIRRLCQRPYWQRLWIVQEVLVAKKARIQAGFTFTTWDRFDLFALHFARENRFTESGDTFDSLSNSLAVKLIPRQIKHQLADSSLRELLEDFGTSKCKDVRDKVYGLAGLANDAEGLEIDYHKTAFQIFVDVMVLQAYRDCATMVAFGQFLQRLLLGEVKKSVPSDAYISPYLVGVLGQKSGYIDYIGSFYLDMVSTPTLDRNQEGMQTLLARANDHGNKQLDQLFLLRTQRLVHQQAIPIQTQASYGLKGGMNFRRYKRLQVEGPEGPEDLEPWGHLQRPATPISEKGGRKTIPGYLRLDNPDFVHSSPRFCVDNRGSIGVVPGNARRGDTLCCFQDCDIVAVLRWSKDRYFFIGRAVFTDESWDATPDTRTGLISLYMTGDALRLLSQ